MESLARKYYQHLKWASSYFAALYGIESYFAKRFFRADLSRIVYASNEYAFRRRFELVDSSANYAEVQASNLRFPFMNYWRQGAWVLDDRAAAWQQNQTHLGTSELNAPLKALAAKTTFVATLYFDREDDAQLAHEYLLMDSTVEQRFYTDLTWKKVKLACPTNIKIIGIDFNPTYTENSWLVQNRIFTIAISFEVRSYIIDLPEQPNEATEEVSEDNVFFLTEEVLLTFLNSKNLPMSTFVLSSLYNYDNTITIDQFAASNITQTSCKINWKVTSSSEIVSYKIITASETIENISADDTSITLKDLQPSSTYNVVLVAETVINTSKTSQLSFTTLPAPLDMNNSLLGTTW